MSTAHNIPVAFDRLWKNGFAKVRDPGASGTFGWTSNGLPYSLVETATAESRALPSPVSLGVGSMFRVIFITDGGNLTITGSDQTIVLTNAGEVVDFVVSATDNAGTKVWRVVGDSRVAYTEVSAATTGLGGAALPADTATTTPIDATPTDTDLAAAFLELTAALFAAGVISTDFTQAT